MDRLQSPDTSFKKLLPKNMQYALEPGESFKKRLQTLVNGIIEAEDPANKRMNEALLKERDEFLKSVRQGHENMQPPLRAHDQELLKANEVRWSPRYRKLIKK
jgi:hypothetical protein